MSLAHPEVAAEEIAVGTLTRSCTDGRASYAGFAAFFRAYFARCLQASEQYLAVAMPGNRFPQDGTVCGYQTDPE